MLRLRVCAIGAVWAAMVVAPSAASDECHKTVCVDPIDEGVGVGGSQPTPLPGGGGLGRSGPAHYYQIVQVPTCASNAPGDDGLCSAAILSCASRGDSGIQLWVYRREVDAAGIPVPGWSWDLIDTICSQTFTPTSAAQVRSLLLSDYRFIPAPKSVTRINPSSGRTVVNAEVVFSADTRSTYSVDVPILGFSVHLDLKPEQWLWHFGDGTTATTATAGRPYPDKDVVHRYRAKGIFAPYVTVTWGGTFRFNGVDYPINGTTTVDGPTSAVTIAEAKGQLVGSP